MNIIKKVQLTRMHSDLGKERGVVLVSCIIFLVLILLMLRITLSGSRMSEQRVGIDQDIGQARETAQLALRSAEKDIVSVLPKGSLSECNSAADSSRRCIDAHTKALARAWIDAWPPEKDKNGLPYVVSTDPIIRNAAEKIRTHAGFYSSKKVSECGKNQALWQCVNWNSDSKKKYYYQSTGKESLKVSEVNEISELNGDRIDIPPRYIVERILPEDSGLPSSANLLFRITAVGFGQSGGSDENVTNAIFQANYAL